MSTSARFPGRDPEGHAPLGENEATRGAILEQLDRILASSLFNHSKRCGPLLSFIVTETLEGRGDQLKERVIGISVFGRKPTYDTTEDPIVRTSAVEVRRRIAQYYHEPGHDLELRIDLTSGSYIPKFRVPAEPVMRVPLATPEPVASELPQVDSGTRPPLEVRTSSRNWAKVGTAVSVAAVAVVLVAAAGLHGFQQRDPLNQFWRPLLDADTVTLAMGNTGELLLSPGSSNASGSVEPSFYDTIQADRVGFVDGMTVARVAALLGSKGKRFEIRRGGSLTLQDLRKAPAVFVGALNNPWTSLLEQQLRFRFVYDETRRVTYLLDQQHPGQTLWKTERDAPYSQLKEDRAIVSRFVDPRTEQTVVLVAGFGRDGTDAAGEFITEPKYLELLARRAPSGWGKKNLQAVIATDLINGHNGPPRVIATHFW